LLKTIAHELYGWVPASFPASGSIEQGVRSLAATTPRIGFTFRRSGVVSGRVLPHRVVLRRARLSANPFSPEFRGRFVVQAGRVVLDGRFALNPFVRAFMTLWFTFHGLAALVGVAAGAALSPQIWPGVLAGLAYALGVVAFAYLGLLLLRFSKSLVRGDPEFIARHIREALEEAAA